MYCKDHLRAQKISPINLERQTTSVRRRSPELNRKHRRQVFLTRFGNLNEIVRFGQFDSFESLTHVSSKRDSTP